MRVLVAPQEFKGSLTASEAAAAIADGVRIAAPDADIDLAPMSDGGAGLVEAMLTARGGQRVDADVHDPLMRPIRASWALLADGTAVIEMAAASGLVLVAPHELDPLRATTYGTGELIRAALEAGAREIMVGVGGSATVDAGAGALQALGVRLMDGAGRDLPAGGGALNELAAIDAAVRDPRLANVRLRVLSDVTNPLCGPEGAAAVFGPQKGASTDDVAVLERGLRRFTEVALRDTGVDVLEVRGGGAAGGLGAGLMACVSATIEPGFDAVALAVGLAGRVAAADLVITGEGRLDAQTEYGKTAAGVAGLARARRVPVIAIAGSVSHGAAEGALFDAVYATTPDGVSVEAAMADATRLLREAAARAMSAWLAV